MAGDKESGSVLKVSVRATADRIIQRTVRSALSGSMSGLAPVPTPAGQRMSSVGDKADPHRKPQGRLSMPTGPHILRTVAGISLIEKTGRAGSLAVPGIIQVTFTKSEYTTANKLRRTRCGAHTY